MKPKLLIVDDEEHIRNGLKTALSLDGYDVEVAADGEEALKKLDMEDIDLLITDLKMPKLTGEELMK
ncbi:MAG: sigma-54-dependent Fis family transcriptional regulator, partial [Spirochaetes bacterium]